MRTLTLILLFLVSCAAFGQGSAFIRFPEAGAREVWVNTGLPSEPPTTGVKTDSSSIDLPLTGAKPADAVFVWDKKSGNLASKTVKDVTAAGTWLVNTPDYIDVAQVTVKVQSAGKPVAAANVTLNDGRRTQHQLIDPSSNGEATFFGIKPGSLKVTIEYKTAGKSAAPVNQLLDAPLKRSDAIPTITIALPEPTSVAPDSDKTAPTESKETKADPNHPKADPNGSPMGAFIGYLVALGVAVAIGYGVVIYAKQNNATVQSKLEQLGVQIPKPGDDDLTNADPIPMAAPIKPAPPQKIVLDDAAPTPLSATPMAPIASIAATGIPRLVAENGDEMPLEAGSTKVGREVGLGLSLVGESTVSRHHAELRNEFGQLFVKDLGSTNGTYVNGAKIDGEVPVRPGDAIQFGSVRFRFEA